MRSRLGAALDRCLYQAQNGAPDKRRGRLLFTQTWHWTLVKAIWLRYQIVLFGSGLPLGMRAPGVARADRALPHHDGVSEVDHPRFRAPTFHRLDHHRGSVPAHFVPVGAPTG